MQNNGIFFFKNSIPLSTTKKLKITIEVKIKQKISSAKPKVELAAINMYHEEV